MHIIKTGRHLRGRFEVSWGVCRCVTSAVFVLCSSRMRGSNTVLLCLGQKHREGPTRVGLGLDSPDLVQSAAGKSTLQSRKTLQPRSMGFNGQNLNFLSIVPWTGLEPRGVHWVMGQTGRKRSERENKTSVLLHSFQWFPSRSLWNVKCWKVK